MKTLDCASESKAVGIRSSFLSPVKNAMHKYCVGFLQDVPDTPRVDPLPYVYTDFIKLRAFKQTADTEQHAENFGYSSIEEVRESIQTLQTPT